MKNLLSMLAWTLGVLFLILACIYWFTPASALPTFLPGYDVTMTAPHIKHGIAAFVVALAFFVYAWFAGAKKAS
jgi:hypothetical protein